MVHAAGTLAAKRSSRQISSPQMKTLLTTNPGSTTSKLAGLTFARLPTFRPTPAHSAGVSKAMRMPSAMFKSNRRGILARRMNVDLLGCEVRDHDGGTRPQLHLDLTSDLGVSFERLGLEDKDVVARGERDDLGQFQKFEPPRWSHAPRPAFSLPTQVHAGKPARRVLHGASVETSTGSGPGASEGERMARKTSRCGCGL